MRVLVVDDEALARARLVRLLARVAGVTVVGEADNGAQALDQIAALAPDVVLLDVEMPGLDGLALAETPGLPSVVFTTAHPQFATHAFDLDAVDYLLKPLRQDRLERALERVRRRAAVAAVTAAATAVTVPRVSHDPLLAVHGPGSVRFIDARRVAAFRAVDKYTAFALDGEELFVRESLDALEARLGPLGFVRVHRATLVRLAAVAALATENAALVVRMTDGAALEVSRRHAPDLRRALGVRR